MLNFEKIKRILHHPTIPINRDGKIFIHLGCGEINSPHFINIDTIPYSHVHYIQEIKNLQIFPNNYADLIYSSHVLEHISYHEIVKVLKEWHRVLKSDGILRISVPDFDKLIAIYLAEGNNIELINSPLMGAQGGNYNFHKAVFNEKYLLNLLLSIGFKEVRHWDPEKVHYHEFEDWASRPLIIHEKEYFLSLNIEAVK